ncbi:MAG: nucleoside phosphorylase [Brevefilum sp.]
MAKQKHLQIDSGDVGRYVLLPGDPARCEKIASHFSSPHEVAYNREFRTITGELLGEKVSVVSTGIGNPSAAIAIEELKNVGADTMIRVGTSGGMQPDLIPGDLGIIQASIRDEGTTKHYMPVEFPALAHVDVVLALKDSSRILGHRSHVGISHSKDSFYGQMDPERMPVSEYLLNRWNAWVKGGTLCAEMESATLFTLGSIYGLRTGSIVLIAMNQGKPELGSVSDVQTLIATAIYALQILIHRDRKERKE